MGIAIKQLKQGKGVPLLFFHGLLGSAADWVPVSSHLPNWSCLAIDLPGHGDTPFEEELHFDLPRFHLIGYSMGGRLAMQYAKKHPEQVASLTLISTHPGLLSDEEKEARWQSDLKWARLLNELPLDEFLHKWYDQPLFKPFVPDLKIRRHQNVKGVAKALLAFSLAKQERFEIDGVIVGERDEKFRSLYPNPIVIEGAGHMVHLENPRRVAEEIVRSVMKSENLTSADSPSALKAYFLASRPQTWIASLSPVLIGSVMAPSLDLPTFTLALLFALLIQIGTNFANDYFDFVKGADQNRKGPKRATQEGWVSPQSMLRMTLLTFALAILIATPLIREIGLWSLAIAASCVAFGILYTGGPKPLGYLGLGEWLVLLFFGPVAGAGSYFLQTGSLPLPVLIASLAPGMISTAILIANNLRDEESDRAANKRTLVVRFGHTFGLIEYATSLLLAASIPPTLIYFFNASPSLLSASLLPPLALLLKIPLLPRTALFLLLYTLAFCAAW